MKRQADLRNIAAAIEMYKADHGDLPKRQSNLFPASHSNKAAEPNIGSTNGLSENLLTYLDNIPKDPNKTLSTKELQFNCFDFRKSDTCNMVQLLFADGEYVYYNNVFLRKAYLLAKVETPYIANFVLTSSNVIYISCSNP